MAIFLDEMLTPSVSSLNEDTKFMQGVCDELKINESTFDRFENANCGFEIVYEMEVASNELNMSFMREEFQLIREAEENGEEKKEGFWAKVVAKIKEWWNKFKAFMGKVWKAIKRFFKGIYEFLFKHQLWQAKRDRLKRMAEQKKTSKFNATVFDTKAVQDLQKEVADLKAALEKSNKELNARIAKEEDATTNVKAMVAANFDKISSLRKRLGETTKKQIVDMAAVEKSLKEAESAQGVVKQMESLVDAYSALSLKYGQEADKKADAAKAAYGAKKPAEGRKLQKEAEVARKTAEEYKNAVKEVAAGTASIKAAVSEAASFSAA